jgi:hypothetical protein
MKNKLTALVTSALVSVTLVNHMAHAQSLLEVFKKATEAMATPEQQRQPAAVSSPAPIVQGPTSAAAPISSTSVARGASEMQNPEVEMVLTKSRASSWADAQKKAVTKVSDGDSLWLYLKAEKPMKNYIYRRNRPDSPAELELVMAPQGAYTSLSQSIDVGNTVWSLRPEEMEMKEITISLAPGASRYFMWPGSSLARSGKVQFFLEFVAGDKARRGQWQNEIFVIGSKQHVNANGEADGGIRAPMAVAPILIDVPDGISKYKALRNEDCTPDPSYSRPCKVRQ